MDLPFLSLSPEGVRSCSALLNSDVEVTEHWLRPMAELEPPSQP